jgi:hypothetical protein
VDDVVEHIMAFDKNKDGKVTRDELPERMHDLIALGDANKDGALDRDEVKQLVTTRATAPGGIGVRADVRFGPGPITGFGPGPGPGAVGAFRVGPGPGPGLSAIEGVVDDLKLSGKKKDRAMAAVKAHQENVRMLMDEARAQLVQQMKEILTEEELQDFQAALDRPRGGTVIVAPAGPRPAGGERRIDRLPK